MKKSELINKKFGKLTVISEAEKTKNGHTTWNCLCDCGNQCRPKTKNKGQQDFYHWQ